MKFGNLAQLAAVILTLAATPTLALPANATKIFDSSDGQKVADGGEWYLSIFPNGCDGPLGNWFVARKTSSNWCIGDGGKGLSGSRNGHTLTIWSGNDCRGSSTVITSPNLGACIDIASGFGSVSITD